MIHPALQVPDDAPSVRGVVKTKGSPTMDRFELEMIATCRGKDDDAAQVLEYRAGETYTVGPKLYKSFVIDARVAKPTGRKPAIDDGDQVRNGPDLQAVPAALPASLMETKEHGSEEPRQRGRRRGSR